MASSGKSVKTFLTVHVVTSPFKQKIHILIFFQVKPQITVIIKVFFVVAILDQPRSSANIFAGIFVVEENWIFNGRQGGKVRFYLEKSKWTVGKEISPGQKNVNGKKKLIVRIPVLRIRLELDPGPGRSWIRGTERSWIPKVRQNLDQGTRQRTGAGPGRGPSGTGSGGQARAGFRGLA